jgi:methionine aminotransferase
MVSKLPQVQTNIFSVMSALANEHKAINLSQGFPDFPVDPILIENIHQAMKDGFNQYAPMPGVPAFREMLAHKIETLYSAKVSADTEITVTPGATYALYTAFATLLHPGDEALVLEPAYDSYIPGIELQGAKPICVPLVAPDYHVDWHAVEQAITPNTKVIIINSPHNPSGYVWTSADMQALIRIVQSHNLYLISDEVYEHITFDGRKHLSVLAYPELFERAFVCFSLGKVLHATGWKMGYCVGPEALMAEYRKIHQFLAFSCNTSLQVALSKYMLDAQTYLSLPHFFEQKRNTFLAQMQHTPFTLHQPAQGSYFQVMGYEKIADKPDKEFAVWLTKEYGVATIPISAFNHNGHDDKLIRFCFAKKDETLQAAIERLTKL